jgi:adenylosuccinate lyase
MLFNRPAINRNLEQYAPFAATERVLMALARAGADRQLMHEKLREHALAAWEELQAGKPNPLIDRLRSDAEIGALLEPDQLAELLTVSGYTGLAAERARKMAQRIREEL